MAEVQVTKAQLEALALAMPIIRNEMRADEWEAFNEFMGNENGGGKGAKQRLGAIRGFVTRLENLAGTFEGAAGEAS